MTEKTHMIALFGPDGSGKSTVADILEEKYNCQNINTLRMHWRPGFLPYKNQIKSKSSKKEFTSPHTCMLRRGPKALLLFLYIVIDFLLGYLFIIRPKLKRGTTIIYERYYYDFLVDQKRYGLQINQNLAKLASRIIPVPDLIVLLDAPSEILYKRKQELSICEIKRQQLAMKEYLNHFENYLLVDTERNNPEQIADIILNSIETQ